MKRESTYKRSVRAAKLINYCNTQVLNLNEQAIIRVLFTHVSDEAVGGPILSLAQIAQEANISQASVSRFVRKVGYQSFEDFRVNFSLDIEQIYRNRSSAHDRDFVGLSVDEIWSAKYQRAVDNVTATNESLDRERLWDVLRILDTARSVTIFGDDHVLSDFYTLQLDLMARGVGTYLFKNQEMQASHVQSIGAGDAVLFLTVADLFIRPDQWNALESLHAREGVTLIGFTQDPSERLEGLCDHFFLYGIPGSENDGFHSLWVISQLMSELLYELP